MAVDPVLVDEWTKLANELDLDAAFIKTNRRMLNFEEISYEQLFQRMIGKWINIAKVEPTLKNFCIALERGEFRMVAGTFLIIFKQYLNTFYIQNILMFQTKLEIWSKIFYVSKRVFC